MSNKRVKADVLNEAKTLINDVKPDISIIKEIIPETVKNDVVLKDEKEDIENILTSTPPDVLEFFKWYLRGYSAKESIKRVKPHLSEHSCAVVGANILYRYKDIKLALYEGSGVGTRDIVQGISDLINHPSPFVKAKGIQLAMKLEEQIRGYSDKENSKGDNYNVVIIKDKTKSAFEIGQEYTEA